MKTGDGRYMHEASPFEGANISIVKIASVAQDQGIDKGSLGRHSKGVAEMIEDALLEK